MTKVKKDITNFFSQMVEVSTQALANYSGNM